MHSVIPTNTRYGCLYAKFEADAWWYELVAVFRRLIFCVISVVFAANQPQIALLVAQMYAVLSIAACPIGDQWSTDVVLQIPHLQSCRALLLPTLHTVVPRSCGHNVRRFDLPSPLDHNLVHVSPFFAFVFPSFISGD